MSEKSTQIESRGENKIHISCPSCGEQAVVPRAAIGRKGKCNRCGTIFPIEELRQENPSIQAVGGEAGASQLPLVTVTSLLAGRATSPPLTEFAAQRRQRPAAPPIAHSRLLRWPWYVGSAACVLGIVAVMLFVTALRGRDRNAVKNEIAVLPQPATTSELKRPPVTTLGQQELRDVLSKGLKLTGTMAPEDVTEHMGMSTQYYHRWNADVRLANSSTVSIGVGPDLFMIEVSADGASYGGFAVFGSESAITGPASYGLEDNYEQGGRRINCGGGRITVSWIREDGDPPGSTLLGKSWSLKRGFPQYSWLKDPAGVCIVLPELRVNTKGGVERFRLLTYFAKPTIAGPWSACEHRLVSIEAAELKKLLADPTSNLVTKVLAANWLAESHPKDAPPLLAAEASRLREGQLLATCLLLMTELKAAGLESHAIDLLQNAKVPNGIRSASAKYVGAVQYGQGLEAVIAATTDEDSAVAGGAIQALGSFGGQRAIDALTGILHDGKRSGEHRRVADSLAHTKEPLAIRVLQSAATGGNDAALEALAKAGLPETFPFFTQLAGTAKDAKQRQEVARGLKNTGGDKALPILLQMLSRDDPASDSKVPDESPRSDGVVSMLVEINNPEATPRLTELAAAGNVRAAQVLADSANDSVRVPLVKLAGEAEGAVKRIALNGLAKKPWAEKNVDVFAKALFNADAEIVREAVRGLEQSKSPRALGLLLPLLDHSNVDVRRTVAWSIRDLPPDGKTAELAAVLVRSKDETVTSACANLLIAAKWQDRSWIPKIGEKLRNADESSRYDLVRLLRHLSGDAMGPKDSSEWYEDSEGWCRKWLEWASRAGGRP